MDERLKTILLLGLGVAAFMAVQSNAATPGEIVEGNAPAPSEEEAESIAQGEGMDEGVSGLAGLGAITPSVRAGSRIRYVVHASRYSGGTPRNFASALQRYGFIIRGYGEQREISRNMTTIGGGKYLWASITLRAGFANGFTLINTLARLAQNAGYSLDQGAGGYRFE